MLTASCGTDLLAILKPGARRHWLGSNTHCYQLDIHIRCQMITLSIKSGIHYRPCAVL